jgi:hypothetical protein
MCDEIHSAMDLVIGQRPDVLWDLESGSKKHKAQWGAIVASGFEGSSASARIGAKIRYDTIHGHESTESTVRFISSSILEEIQGGASYVRHQWRWEGTAPPEQGNDAPCLPVLAPPSGDVAQGLLVTNVWRHSRESWLMCRSALTWKIEEWSGTLTAGCLLSRSTSSD